MPQDASVAYEIAQVHAAARQVDRALEMYEAAIGLSPQCLDAHWERGVLLERRGQIDEALDAWRRSDLSRDAGRHSLYLAAALKSPRSTNQSLLAAQQEWARYHAQRAKGKGPRRAKGRGQRAEGRGQRRAKGRGQRAEGKGRRPRAEGCRPNGSS